MTEAVNNSFKPLFNFNFNNIGKTQSNDSCEQMLSFNSVSNVSEDISMDEVNEAMSSVQASSFETIDRDGNKICWEEVNQDESFIYTNSHGDRIYPKYSMRVYNPEGVVIETGYADDNQTRISSTYWEQKEDGTLYRSGTMDYYQDGTKGVSKRFDEDGNITHYSLNEWDFAGGSHKIQQYMQEHHYNNLYDRNLLEYKQFDVIETYMLASMYDSSWEIASEYLEQNPDASFEDINEYLSSQREEEL